MPNKNYRRGYELEYRTKKIFEDCGFLVFRSPASKTCIDLIAFDKTAKYFVQAKKTADEKLNVYKLGDLLATAERFDAKPLLVYSFDGSPVYVKEMSSRKENLKKFGIHKELKKFLKIDLGEYGEYGENVDYLAR
jgi:Holliday junction resolvase